MKYFMIDSLCGIPLLIVKSRTAQNDIVLISKEIQVIIHELESKQQMVDKSMKDPPILPRVVICHTPNQAPRPVWLGV